jgi:hypothetical protein
MGRLEAAESGKLETTSQLWRNGVHYDRKLCVMSKVHQYGLLRHYQPDLAECTRDGASGSIHPSGSMRWGEAR